MITYCTDENIWSLTEEERRKVRRKFCRNVETALGRYGFWEKPQKILIACSGGVDSLGLLYCLKELSERYALSLGVFSLNHKLRPSAMEEISWVKQHAERLGIPIWLAEEDIAQVAADQKISLETAGRNCRYAHLRHLMKTENFSAIATAHHQDDQAETVLAHILRGTGLQGLGGIRFWQNDIIRPFLRVSKKEISSYLAAWQVQAVLDESNLETLYERNRLRLELLPVLRTFNPRVVEALARLANTAAADSAYLDSLAEAELAGLWADKESRLSYRPENIVTSYPLRLKRRRFAALPIPLQYRLWQRLLSFTTLTQVQVEQLGKLVSSEEYKQFSVGKVKVSMQYDTIEIGHITLSSSRYNELRRLLPHVTSLAENLSFEQAQSLAEQWKKEGKAVFLMPDTWLQAGWELRYRQAGDCIAIYDKTRHIYGHKKVKKYLIERKIPLAVRDQLLFLATGKILLGEMRPGQILMGLSTTGATYTVGATEEDV